jgi:hypothetical protein
VAVALSLANAKLSFGSSQLGAYLRGHISSTLRACDECLSQRVACLLTIAGGRRAKPTLQLMSRPRIICRLHRLKVADTRPD